MYTLGVQIEVHVIYVHVYSTHTVLMSVFLLWVELMGRTKEDPEAGVWEVWTEVWGAHQSEQYSPSANGKGLLI